MEHVAEVALPAKQHDLIYSTAQLVEIVDLVP